MPLRKVKDPNTGEERLEYYYESQPQAQSQPQSQQYQTLPARLMQAGRGASTDFTGLETLFGSNPITRSANAGLRNFLQEGSDFVNDELAKRPELFGPRTKTSAAQPDAPFGLTGKPLPKVKTEGPGEEFIGNLVGGILGFAATKRAMGAVGGPIMRQPIVANSPAARIIAAPSTKAAELIAQPSLKAKAAGLALKGAYEGAVPGAVSSYAFQDPYSGNLSNLLQEKFKDTPLIGDLARYTAVSADDSNELARFKNAVTDWIYGLPLGSSFELLPAAAKSAYRSALTRFTVASAKYAKTVDAVEAATTAAPLTPEGTPAQVSDVAAVAKADPVVRITGRKRSGVDSAQEFLANRQPRPFETPGVVVQPKLGDPAVEAAAAKPPEQVAEEEFIAATQNLQAETIKIQAATSGPEPQPGQAPALGRPSYAELQTVPTGEVKADPVRFQFKQAGQTKTGQSGSLVDTQVYNPTLANVISVWRDPADDALYVVNGHNRLALANRAKYPTVNVRLLYATSAQEARLFGAMQNIAEGNGTPVDAAKIMRDQSVDAATLQRYGLQLTQGIMAKAAPLSQLPDELFGQVARGEMTVDMGAAIGSAGTDAQVMRDLAKAAKKGRWGAEKTAEAAQIARFATVEQVADPNALPLPGFDVLLTSNFSKLLDVRVAIRRQLGEEIRALGAAANAKKATYLRQAGNVIDEASSQAARTEAAQGMAVFNRLANLKGPLSDLINELADGVKGKTKAADLVGANIQRIRAALDEEANGPRLPVAEQPVAKPVEAAEGQAPAAQAAPVDKGLASIDRAVLRKSLQNLTDDQFEKVLSQLESKGAIVSNPSAIGEQTIEQPIPQPPAPAAAPAAPASSTATAPNLPTGLKRSTPRYVKTQLVFESDVDLAIYTVTSKTPSAARDKFVSWLQGDLGMQTAEIQRIGIELRAQLKNAPNIGQPGKFTVPDTGAWKASQDLSVDLPQFNREPVGRLGENYTGRTLLSEEEMNNLVAIVEKTTGMKANQVEFPEAVTGQMNAATAASYGVAEGSTYNAFGQYKRSSSSPANDIIQIAMMINGRPTSFVERILTAYHESFHRVQRRYLTEAEQKLLLQGDREIRMLAARAVPAFKEDLLSGKIGSIEAQAMAYSGWWRYGGDYEKATWAQPFKKLVEIGTQAVNYLRGRGYRTWDDVFEQAYQGEFAERAAKQAEEVQVDLSIQPPDFDELARKAAENREGLQNGDLTLEDVMRSDTRRFISRSGKTRYVSQPNENLAAMNQAFGDFLSDRANVTGIPSYIEAEINQKAIERLKADNLEVDSTITRVERAMKGDVQSQDDIVALRALQLHRDHNMNSASVAALRYVDAADDEARASGMQQLIAAVNDQLKLDVAYMSVMRKGGQRLRVGQFKTVGDVTSIDLPAGTVLSQGTTEEAAAKILTEGFGEADVKPGMLGNGIYFTTTPKYTPEFGTAEIYGDVIGDIKILDLVSANKRITDLLNELGLGKAKRTKDGLALTPVQQAAIQDYAATLGYQGIRFDDALGAKAVGDTDQVVIFDVNAANRIVGSDAAMPPVPAAEPPLRSLLEQATLQAEDVLQDRLPPDVLESIERGEPSAEAEAIMETLARATIQARDTKGFAPRFTDLIQATPSGSLTQDAILSAYRGAILLSGATWYKMLFGSAYRAATLPLSQMIGAEFTALDAIVKGQPRAAYLAQRRAQLSAMMYPRMMEQIPNAIRLAWTSLKENETFMNLGRNQYEMGRKAGYTAKDQLELMTRRQYEEIDMEAVKDAYFMSPVNTNPVAVGMRWIAKGLGVSGRVAGSIDTFISSLVGPASEFTRLVDQELHAAETTLGLQPGSKEAWDYAVDRAESLLKRQLADVQLTDGRMIKDGQLVGQHAENAMNWVNYTDPVATLPMPRTYEYGVRAAREEGLTDAIEINNRALAWMNEAPDVPAVFKKGSEFVSFVPKMLQDQISRTPVLGLIHPLNRGPANIVKSAMRATGFMSPFVDSWWRDIHSEDLFTRERAIGEIGVGYMTLAAGIALVSSGNVEFTGPGPANYRTKRAMELRGWQAYSVRFRLPFSGEWSPYFDLAPLDTVSNVFGTIGAYIENANSLTKEDAETLGSASMLALAETAKQMGIGQFTKSIFGGISEIMELLTDLGDKSIVTPEGRIGSVEKYIQKRLAGFMPAAIRRARNATDPYSRVVEASDMPAPFSFVHETLRRFQNQIPGLSESLPPVLHPITGEPVELSGVLGSNLIPSWAPWLRAAYEFATPLSAFKKRDLSWDPVDVEMGKLFGRGAVFQVWTPQEFGIPNRALNQTEMNRLVEIGTKEVLLNGKTMHQELLDTVTSDPLYLSLPYDVPSKALESARVKNLLEKIQPYKEEAKARYAEENTDIRDALLQLQQDRDDREFMRRYSSDSRLEELRQLGK